MTVKESILLKQNEALQQQVVSLQNQLDAVVKLLLGKKSEKRSFAGADQLELFANTDAAKQDDITENTADVKPTKRKGNPTRKALPENLRREIIEIDPDEIPEGSIKIGSEITEVLEIRAAEIYVKQYVRNKYALANQEGVVIGKLPLLPIYKSNAGASILVYLLISKYQDHMPWYRIISKFNRLGYNLSASTINNWFKASGELLRPLYNMMVAQIKQSNYLQVDESTIKVLDPDKKGTTHTGYFWVYHSPPDKIVIFDYQKGRASMFPKEFLNDFTGTIQTDAYAGYNFIGNCNTINHIGCMAHARREFIEAEKNDRDRSEQMLRMIAKLYQIEKEAKATGMTDRQRKTLRTKNAVPVLKEIKTWLDLHIYQTIPKSKIGNAIRYMTNHWSKLSGYVKDGKLEIDNNLAENKIRLLALGRKNYLFSGNHDAAQNAAMIYSFLGTCKANNINPNKWLLHAIEKLPYCKSAAQYQELLPQNYIDM